MFKWVVRPQLCSGFVVACLCVGALGNYLHPAQIAIEAQGASQPQVRGASTPLPSPAPDCSVRPCLALTFDDGPNAQATPRILDILTQEQVHATFFVMGTHIAGNEELLRRMHREGHEIGNHSWSHPDFTKISPAEVDAQLELTQTAIVATGVPAPTMFRPPYGAVNDMVKSHTHMTIVRWNIDPEDWKAKDTAKVYEGMLAQAKPGGVILLHDMHQQTVDALVPALQVLKLQYQFVTASELLHLTPGDQGQFFGH